MFAAFFAKFLKNFLTSLIIFYSRKLIFKIDSFISVVLDRVEYASEAGYASMINFYEDRYERSRIDNLDITCPKCGKMLNSRVMHKIGLETCPHCRASIFSNSSTDNDNFMHDLNEGLVKWVVILI